MSFISNYESYRERSSAFLIRVERETDVEPKIFKNGKYLNFYVKISLDLDTGIKGPVYEMNDVTLVKYELHQSYREPVRTSDNNLDRFAIRVWTYGFYPVKATIYLKFGKPLIVSGYVKFDISPDDRKLMPP